MQQRLWRHHLPLLALTVVCVAALYTTRPFKDVITRASFATAYTALALLAATLLVGPWNVLRRRQNPVSSDLRRDLGIWAGMVSALHAGVGQCVHLRGRPWLYYVYGAKHHGFPLRHDLFGLANYTGAVATLVLLALLATSNDAALRALGTPRWKQLQRWNYAVFALTAVHAFAFQGIEKQHLLFVATVILCVAVTLVMQTAGWMSRRSVRAMAPSTATR